MGDIITASNTFTGRISRIKIDGSPAPITSDGLVITHVAEYQIEFVVGTASPRARVAAQYFRIDCMLPENTLENLKFAWNLSGSIVNSGTYQRLYLGMEQQPPTHTLDIYGWIYPAATRDRERRWFFDQVCFFEPKAQQLIPTALAPINVSFYAYGNSDATSGQEFGRLESDDS